MAVVARKVALVTGATRGIGRTVAENLGAAGWTVAVHHMADRFGAEEVVNAIRREGGEAVSLEADLGRAAEADDLVGKVVRRVGPLTLLVNAESVLAPDDAMTATRDTWDRNIETNLHAPFVLSREFARQLPPGVGVAEGDGGCVVNILDRQPPAMTIDSLSYSLSKSGLASLTQILSLALAPRVRVNGICPGRHQPASGQGQARRHHGRADEIATTMRFIVETPSLTGQILALRLPSLGGRDD